MTYFQTSDFDYVLEEGLIAQRPAAQRDQSRLMTLRRNDGHINHRLFIDLPLLLKAGDLLIVNDTRVIPGKFHLVRSTGGRIEGLFLQQRDDGLWQVLLKNAGRCRVGETLAFAADASLRLELVEALGEGR